MRAVRWLLFALALGLGALLLLVGGVIASGWLADEPHAFDADRARGLVIGPATELIPGAGVQGLPAGVALGAANNNLDWVEFGGRTWLAFRSAPRHWASDDARMLLVSRAGGAASAVASGEGWRYEMQFDLPDRDLREPRFLVMDGRLLFYFFEADSQPGVFAPHALRVAELGTGGRWSEPRAIFEPGHVVWRPKLRNGHAWMSVYSGRIYDDLGRAGGVRLLRSDDGLAWASVSGDASPVSETGTSECAFEFDAQGNLVALVRIEARGALVCTAPRERLERWDCTPTPYRHDSPALVRHGDRFFAIARRSLGGPVERFPRWLPRDLAPALDQLRYWWTRLRTSVYEVLPAERRIVPLADLPSRGDTAFAAAIDLGDGRFAVANYASPLDEPDWPWAVGQNVETRIYGLEITLPEAR